MLASSLIFEQLHLLLLEPLEIDVLFHIDL